jgi:diguanylate cyclase (GGDEF)-like protein
LVADSDQPGVFSEESKLLADGFARQAARLVALNLKHTALGLEHERLREWNRRLEMMASRLKVEDVVGIMRELVPQLVDCDRLVLMELLPEVGRARVLLADPGAAGGPAAGSELDIRGSLAEQAQKLREWRLVDDFYRRSIDLARYTEDESRDHGFRSVLVGPLMIDDDCRYLMAMESRKPNAFQASLDTIHIVANQFSLALRSAAMYEEKEALALRDGLTGLWNHRHFQEKLEQLLAPDRSQPLSLALFDIDRFKKLNDTFGHPVGDVVLREVASRIRGRISQYDFAARYGGEEFVVIWPGSDLDQAERLAQELRTAIGGRPVSTQAGELSVTVSLGLAAYPADARDKGGLIQAADQALYAAKRGGRDQMVCFRSMDAS